MPEQPTFRFGHHRLDLVHQRLWCGDETVPLRLKPWLVLVYLLQRPGRLVPAAELLDAVWPQAAVTPKALTNCIVELRRALGDAPASPRIIQTVHRRGYRLGVPVHGGALPAPVPAVPSAAVVPAVPAAPSPAHWAPALPAAASTRCFVGRDSELALLLQLQARSLAGQHQLALLGADPGLGKTALIEAFVARRSDAAPPALLAWGQCVEQASEHEAFGPVLRLLSDLAAGPAAALVMPLLRRFAPSWLVQMPWLVADSELQDLRRGLIGTGSGRMLRECCALLVALSQQQPLVVVLEDLHWSDSATIDLLGYVAQMRTPARLMLVASYQPIEAVLRDHPVTAMARRLRAHGQLTDVALPPLTAAQAEAYVAQRVGPGDVAARLAPLAAQQCEGHPLFLSSSIDHLVAQGWLAPGEGGLSLTVDLAQLQAGWPEALRPLLEARLALLSAGERALLQAASLVGMQFEVPLLEAMLQRPADGLTADCQALAERGLFIQARPVVRWPDGTSAGVYAFEHDAYRRALHNSLAPACRQVMHQRLAQRLEQGWGDRVADVAGPLAKAYEAADLPEASARVLELTAEVSVRRYAYGEAADAIEAALRQVARLPDSPARKATELRLQLALGNLMLASRGLGHPRALQAYRQAEALGQAIDAPRDWLRAQMGVCMALIFTGQAEAARAVGRVLVAGARQRRPGLLAVAHTYAGLAELGMGALADARSHLEQALQLTPEPGVPLLIDVHSMARLHLGRTLIHQGELAAGRQMLGRAVAHSRAVGIPLDLLQTLYWAADSLRVALATDEASALFEEVLALAALHDLPHYRSMGQLGRIACQAADQRDLAETTALVQQVRMSGERWGDVTFLMLLAETQQALGDPAAALATVATAFACLDTGALYRGRLQALKATLVGSAGVASAV